MKKTVLATTLSVTAFLLTTGSISSWADESYQQALDQYRSGNYTQALQLFQHSHQQQPTPELRYNLGLCHLQLGALDIAQQHFDALTNDPILQWWSRYQLAVIAQQQGDHSVARDQYKAVAENSDDQQLAERSQRRYTALANGDITAENYRQFFGSLSAGVGSDDSVIDPSDLTGSQQDDTYTEYLAIASYRWGESTDDHWQIEGFGFSNRYSEVDDFNTNLLNLALSRHVRWQQWRLSAGLEQESSTVDGGDYLNHWGLKLTASQRLANRARLQLRYHYRDIRAGEEEYQPFAGSSHRWQLNYRLPLSDRLSWDSRYRFTSDQRGERIGAITSADYSANRHGLHSKLVWQGAQWQHSLMVSWQASDYQNDYLLANGQLLGRSDHRSAFSWMSSYQPSDQWELSAEINHTDNQSSLDDYDYQRTTLFTGVSYSF